MATYSGTPATATAGQSVTAAFWNAEIRDPLAALSGAWNSYTPTLSGFTPGNGTASGAYIRVGALVIFRASFVFGSTSAAAADSPRLTLPVTATAAGVFMGRGACVDSSAGSTHYAVEAMNVSTTTVALYRLGSEGVYTAMSTSTPFTWATGDSLKTWGIYEAA